MGKGKPTHRGGLELLFARRYLRSRKSLSVINTTAAVSSIAIGVAVAAMVILLSVYNGFDTILRRLDTASEADIIITPAKGKHFHEEAFAWEELTPNIGVEAYAPYIEESVMVEYHGKQAFATLRGVEQESYSQVVALGGEDMLLYGNWQLALGDLRRVVVGRDIDNIFADGFSVRNTAVHGPLKILTLRKENISPLLPLSAIKSDSLRHGGTLSERATGLTSHIFTSLDWAQRFLTCEGRLSGVAVKATSQDNIERVAKRVQRALGEEFKVRSRYEVNETLYRATKFEKWSIFFILLLVTIIAGATIIGSLVMLITEKRDDIATLYSIGARRGFVARIFTLAGGLLGGRGVLGGVLLGVVVCSVQILFGVIKMPGSTFLIEEYPVEMRLGDIVGISLAVLAVTLIITNFTISRMIPRGNKPNEIRN